MRIVPTRCLIDERLREANMTRPQLCERIGMKRNQLWRYASMESTMTLPIAVLIADTLGCCPRNLYDWAPAGD